MDNSSSPNPAWINSREVKLQLALAWEEFLSINQIFPCHASMKGLGVWDRLSREALQKAWDCRFATEASLQEQTFSEGGEEGGGGEEIRWIISNVVYCNTACHTWYWVAEWPLSWHKLTAWQAAVSHYGEFHWLHEWKRLQIFSQPVLWDLLYTERQRL